MKIKILRACVVEGTDRKAGDVVEVQDYTKRLLVDQMGAAEAVDEVEAETESGAAGDGDKEPKSSQSKGKK